MKKVVIFGTGNHARMAYFYLSTDSSHEVSAFTVHETYLSEKKLLGLDVIPFECLMENCPPSKFNVFVAVGYARVNKVRAGIYNECKTKGYTLISYVSSKAIHWEQLDIGDNCFILENVVIHPYAKIGNNVMIASGSQISHDSVIGDHCFIAAHAVINGNTEIGPYSFIGANATIRDSISIGSECIIGAGAIIMKDTRDGEVYIVENTKRAAITSSTLARFIRPSFFRRSNNGVRDNS